MNNVRPIRNEADYDWALAEVAAYFEHIPEPGTAEADRFDVLSDLIDAYESKNWPIDAADPVDAIASLIASGDRSRAELADLLGSRSRASEIINRKRALTVPMIHKLNEQWHLPADVLVRPYRLAVARRPTASHRLSQPKR